MILLHEPKAGIIFPVHDTRTYGYSAAISANGVINVPGTLLCLNRYSLDGIWMTNDCNEYMFRVNVAIGMSVIDDDAVCVIFLITTTMNAAKASLIVRENRGTIRPLHE